MRPIFDHVEEKRKRESSMVCVCMCPMYQPYYKGRKEK